MAPQRTLFFCRTPLQSLIAQEIIDRHPGWSTVVYYPTSSSSKHQYYFEKLRCTEKVFAPLQQLRLSDTLTEIRAWWAVPRSIRQQAYAELFVSSIGAIPFSMFVVRNPRARLNTFDDGTFNVNPEVFPRWISHEPFARKLAKRILRGVDNVELISRGARHYTIFDSQRVVGIPYRIHEIDLLNHGQWEVDGPATRRRVRVMLGTLLPRSTDRSIYEGLTASPGFDAYLPHPAEHRPARIKDWVRDACPHADPEKMIAEDFVIEMAKSGLRPIVYGFNSTALLTLARVTRTVSIQIAGLHVQLPSELLKKARVRSWNFRSPPSLGDEQLSGTRPPDGNPVLTSSQFKSLRVASAASNQ